MIDRESYAVRGVGDPDPPPARQRKNNKQNRRAKRDARPRSNHGAHPSGVAHHRATFARGWLPLVGRCLASLLRNQARPAHWLSRVTRDVARAAAVVIDLTNIESTHDQISPSVPTAEAEATNIQSDVAQPDAAQYFFSGFFALSKLSSMSSSLINNSLHVSFDSVLAMDNTGILAMFGALVASGLKGFLGCPAIFYEDSLTEFFQNGSIRDGMVVNTTQGHLSEIPKDLVFDARSIFSHSGKQVSTSCKKREIKIEFRLLSDILAKSIFAKGGPFDAVTHERFLLMADITGGVQINWGRLLFNIFKEMVTAGSRQEKWYAIQICVLLKDVPALEFGDSKAFPSPRILTEKTVHRYVVINEKVTVEEVANKPRVKRTPVKKAVSRKRPATAEVVEPVVSKKKRTKVGKADKGLVLITVAQEVAPLKIVEPTRAAPSEQPPVPKRKSKKRRLRLDKDSDDEIVKERGAKSSEPTVENEPVVKSTAEEVRTTSTDDVDLIIEKVIAETAQKETDEEEQNVDGIDVEGTTVSGTDVGEQTVPRDEETDRWFNLSYEEFIAQEADRPVVTASDTDEEMETVDFGTDVGEQELQIFDENESNCGSLRQSGPRPDPRLLRQAALEALTRSARTDSPRRTARKQFSGDNRRRRRRRTAAA
ncbi:hypothetical protein F511_37321 [Dorcoceras hygrometricum]|uniref:Splicing factor 3B subunit 1-like n=1 Tax=Dorcoceras hygrometricum TaxID=472368 RepID=A0A2Z7C9L2_9LAMI|nr:hypothetical protein F511_37321 [Dorcoceras hygrometricum]